MHHAVAVFSYENVVAGRSVGGRLLVRKCLSLLFFFQVVFLDCSVFSQDGTVDHSKEFLLAIDEYRKSLSNVGTYCLKLNEILLVDGSGEKAAGQIGNDEPTVSIQRHTVEILCDQPNDRMIAIESFEPLFPELGFGGALSVGSTMNLYLIDGIAASRLAGSKFNSMNAVSAIPLVDPLTVGGVFWGELQRLTPVPRAISNLGTWNSSRWVMEQKGPIRTFRLPVAKDSTTSPLLIGFDTSRGWLPVEIQKNSISRGKVTSDVAGKVQLRKLSGEWLPFYALYNCGGKTVRAMHFDWFSINMPIPEDFFDPQSLLLLSGAK